MGRSAWNGPVTHKGYELSVEYGGPPVTDEARLVAPDDAAPTEFASFEETTRGLLTVPDSDLDQELKKNSRG